MKHSYPILLAALLVSVGRPAASQDTQRYRDPFPSGRWCEDSGTACWLSPGRSNWFNGIRIIADVDLKMLLQHGQNRFVSAGFAELPKLAVEINIYGSWAAFQIALRGPGNVFLDSLSEARALLATGTNGSIPTDWGLSFGISFFDSSIAIIRGDITYDTRAFRVPLCTSAADSVETTRLLKQRTGQDSTFRRNCVRGVERSDSYFYVAFQPLSGLRSAIKARNEREQDSDNEPATLLNPANR